MAQKIKLVYLIDTFFVGGAEKLLLDLCKNIDRERFEIYVAAVICGGPLETEFARLNIPLKIFTKKSKLGLELIWPICSYLKTIKPQIVHTHLFGADTWGRIAAILARVPQIVSTEHNVNLNHGFGKKMLKRILALFTSKIIAVSAGVRDYSINAEKISSKKIVVIHNGIDLAQYPYRGWQPINLAGPINAVTVGRLEKQKGQKYLIMALPLILEEYPNFTLNIVGKGSQAKYLEDLAKGLGVLENIVFWGERGDIAGILKQMDIFVLASLWEGLGLVLLEAQAVGLPVLATDIAGVREVIKNKFNGLLFAPENPHAIAETVKTIITDQALSQKIVDQAKNDVINNFALTKMVSAYSQLYLTLIEHD